MPALMNSYTTDTPEMCIPRDNLAIAKVIRVEQWPTLKYSLLVKTQQQEVSPLNSRVFALFDEIENLKDNWDEEGSPAPVDYVKNFAKAIIEFLNSTGQALFNVAPGPRGEIMIDVRKGIRSFEILIYPNKVRFVTFSENEESTQGSFEAAHLPKLLTWVNQ